MDIICILGEFLRAKPWKIVSELAQTATHIFLGSAPGMVDRQANAANLDYPRCWSAAGRPSDGHHIA
jgi:hypothetical protein